MNHKNKTLTASLSLARDSHLHIHKTISIFLTAGALLLAGFFAPTFVLADTLTSITLSSPNGSEQWRGTQNITWTTAEGAPGDTVDIFYSIDNFGSQILIVSGVPHDARSYPWDTTTVADGANYKIKVRSSEAEPEVFDTSDNPFTIDNTQPTTSFVIDPPEPDGDNGWYKTKPTITLTCIDPLVNASASGCLSVSSSFDGMSTSTARSPVVLSDDQIPEGETTLHFFSQDSAVDTDGNHNSEMAQSRSFKVDSIPPTVNEGSYTLDGSAANAFFNPNSTSTTVSITATEPVEWVSAKIVKTDDPDVFKTKFPGNDGFSSTDFDWDGSLSEGGPGPIDGEYKIIIHITDAAGHDVSNLELNPFHIFVDTQAPTVSDLEDPDPDAVYKAGSSIPIRFTPADSAPETPLSCGYKVGENSFVSLGPCTSGSEFSGFINEVSLVDGRNIVRGGVRDSAGNSAESDPVSIVFDNNNTLTVDDTPLSNPDFVSIQEAIDRATRGDTIQVRDGTYREDVKVSKDLTLHSDNGATTTVIVGQNPSSIFGAVTVSADGVTVGDVNHGFSIEGVGQAAVYVEGRHTGLSLGGNTIVAADNKNAFLTEGGQSNFTISDNTFEGDASQLVYVNGTASVGNESLNINFTGNTFAGTAIGPALGQEAMGSTIAHNIFTTQTNWAVIELFGDDNTISQNKITNSESGDGIRIVNTSASPVSRAHVLDNLITTGGDGIEVGGSAEDEEGEELEIRGNAITAGANGIYIGGDGVNLEYETITVSGNDLLNNGERGFYLGGSRVEVNFDTLSLQNNKVTGSGDHGIAIGNIRDGGTAIISLNTIHENGFEEGGSGISVYYVSSGATLNITNNLSISENRKNGIHIYEIYNSLVSISDNKVEGNGRAGIFVNEVSSGDSLRASLTVSGNTVSDNGSEEDDGDATGIHINDIDDSDVSINQNSISTNGTGLFVGESSQTVDATNNWWGTISGPRHPANTFNVGSQGDAIVGERGEVNFVPWLNAAPPAGVSFAPVTTTNPVNGFFASIGAGVAAVNPGGTVNAVVGIYTESGIEVLTSNVSIVGASGAVVKAPNGCPSTSPSAVFHLHEDTVKLIGFDVDAAGACAHGIHIGDLSEIQVSGVEVSGNQVHGAFYGITLSFGSSPDARSMNVVKNNGIFNNDTGILIDSARHNLVKENQIHDNANQGILFGTCVQQSHCGASAPSRNLIENNVIENNGIVDTGIFIDGLGAANAAHFNKITANGFGVNNDTSVLFNAERNWWGHLRGPHHAGLNPLGGGDPVSDLVDFSPWCSDEDCEEFASIGPLAALRLSFNPTVVTIPDVSSATVKAVDEEGITLLNSNSTQITLIADGGAFFGANLLTLTDGSASTTVSSSNPGTINVTATEVGGAHATSSQVVFVSAPATGIVLNDVVPPSFGQATNKYLEGWHYIFRTTVNNPSETKMFVRFSDWLNLAPDPDATIEVNGNTRLLFNPGAGVGISEQDINSGFSLGNLFSEQTLADEPTAVDLSGVDNNLDKAGRQVQFDVFTKLPLSTVPGFYTTEFGICTVLADQTVADCD